MKGIIRKLKLSYPFQVGGQQKIDVFSADDTSIKFDGHSVHSIKEEQDEQSGEYIYLIFVSKGETVKIWKSVTPQGCTKEIEYFLQ